MQSYLTHLECTYCNATYSADEPMRLCADAGCGKVLYPRYDLDAAASALDRAALRDRAANMWRYFEVMPVRDPANVITLGEGFTPIFRAERLGPDMGAPNLLIKDEGRQPHRVVQGARAVGRRVQSQRAWRDEDYHAVGGQTRRAL